MYRWIKQLFGNDQDIEELREQLQDLETDLSDTREQVHSNSDKLQELEQETERNRNSIAEIKDSLDETEQTPEEWTETETQVLSVLFDAEKFLTNAEIGQRLSPEKDGNKVRPIINRIKSRIDVQERKKGRAKAYKLPQSVQREYLENGNLQLKTKNT